jgi:16S rRNA G966 N2-methylase RsmD
MNTALSLYQTAKFKALFEKHKHENPIQLALKLASQKNSFTKELIQQIDAWQRSKEKLPLWYKTPGIIFAPKVNMEQCSSEKTAQYKGSKFSGKLALDLTGGFGIDSFYLSKNFEKIIYVEQNTILSEITAHNYNILKAENIEIVNSDAETFIKKIKQKANLIYIDPARRDEHNRKISAIENTHPNVLKLLPLLKQISNTILIKMSPMLDIKAAINELQNVSSVYIVSVKNECKELLFEINNNSPISIKAIDINDSLIQEFSFTLHEEEKACAEYSDVLNYIYEPGSSLLKSGAYNLIAEKFGVKKIHLNSHLYTSNNLIENFQGRKFKVISVCAYNKNEVAKYLKENKANITVRNFKEDVKSIYKKLKINEGGNTYIFATTLLNNKPAIIICEKI